MRPTSVIAAAVLLLGGVVLAAARAASTVRLTVTINGAGTVRLSGKPPISCKKTCRATIRVPAGKRIAVAITPTKPWKLAPLKGVCTGTAAKCSFKTTHAASLGVTFLAPGLVINPIPLNTRWTLPGAGWTLKVVSAKPNGQVTDSNGQPQSPPAGAQYFMPYVEATYTGSGSSDLTPLSQGVVAEGVHNAPYSLNDSPGCGPGHGKLPDPDLQETMQALTQVASGQSVAGNICFQIASNDAASLLLDFRTYTTTGARLDTWFALR